jgi:hypothetical protein
VRRRELRASLLAGLLAGCTPAAEQAPWIPAALAEQLEALRQGGVALEAGRTGAPRVMPPIPYDPEARPVLNGLPAHLEVPAGEYTLLVLPVEAYRTHFVGGARAAFVRRFGALREIILAGGQEVDGEIPVLPAPLEAQRFRARRQWVTFGGGRGVGFITQFSDDASPPEPDSFEWVFLGLSDDGRWLVSLRSPLRVQGFPASEDPRRVAAALDTLPASQFTPDPAVLERIIRSLRVSRGTPP